MKTAVTEPLALESPANQESWLDWVRGWNRFWFEPKDPTLICLMRIFCGIATLYVHLSYSFGLLGIVGPNAWGDRQFVQYWTHEVKNFVPGLGWQELPSEISQGASSWSVWYHIDDPFWIVFLHVAFLLAMFMYTVGFCTKMSGVVTWIATLSYINRMPNMTFGMDVMMVIVQTCLLIGPTGAVCSVDHWLQRRRFWWWRIDAVNPDTVPKSGLANLALRILQIHFCIVYLVTGLAKLQGHFWWSGDAVYLTIDNPIFAPMQSSIYMNALVFITKHRWLYSVVFSALAWSTLALEIGFPALIWNRRTRWLMLTGSVMLHTGIGFVMGLGAFSMFMLIFVASFVPPEVAVQLMLHVQTWLDGPMSRFGARVQSVWNKGGKLPVSKPKEEALALHP
jgi:hypothetical protein